MVAVRKANMIADLWRDLRYGMRTLRPFGDESWCDVKVACMSVSVFK